jgi:putative FmdB family regulatory protein
MPTYSYECECGQVWDVVHSIHDDPELECDNCAGSMTRKISPISSIKFNGKGFYSTDKHA